MIGASFVGLEDRWRVGRSVGRTIYIQLGPEPSKDDVLIGVMDSPQLAAAAVEAHNAQLPDRTPTGNPDDGHQFRFSVTCQGSSKVVGEAHHRDADWIGDPYRLTVRAWSLSAACRAAADTPLHEWEDPQDDDEGPSAS